MCIYISTTSHPEYPLIVLSNRDEYFGRPTELANIRNLPNGDKILSPLDLGRKEHGTWIGVTSLGRLAVLVNYSEPGMSISEVSRGILPIEYLTSDLDDDAWYESLEEKLAQKFAVEKKRVLNLIGGFTLVYGKLTINPKTKKINPLNIISNRGDRGKIHANPDLAGDLHLQIALQETFSVSNSLYYEPWRKVKLGCDGLSELVDSAVNLHYTHETLVEECFGVLSRDSFPAPEIKHDLPEKTTQLKDSIFIPPVICNKGSSIPVLYGTRTQTVILLHKSGILHYYEKDLHSTEEREIKIKNQHFEFDLTRNCHT